MKLVPSYGCCLINYQIVRPNNYKICVVDSKES